MKSSMGKWACAAVAVAAFDTATADTVAWWRFGDGAAGTAATTLANAVDFKYEGTELPSWKPLIGMMNGDGKEAFYVRLHKTSGDTPRPSISLRFHNEAGD